MQFVEWDNFFAAQMPAKILPMDAVDTYGSKGGDSIRKIRTEMRDNVETKSADAAQILARLRTVRGRLPADFRFDRLEANQRP